MIEWYDVSFTIKIVSVKIFYCNLQIYLVSLQIKTLNSITKTYEVRLCHATKTHNTEKKLQNA